MFKKLLFILFVLLLFSNESGFGVQTNIGGSTNKQGESFHPSGTTTVSMKDKGSETEQTTHATIGNGTIVVGGDSNPELAGLNRNVNKSQEITKDMITGALDGSATIDNRVFTESGRENIINQHTDLGKNAVMATAGATGTIVGTVKVAADVIGGKTDIEDSVSAWKANQSGMATGIQRGGSDEAKALVSKIENKTATPEDLQKLAGMTADGSVNLVYSNDKENVVIVDKDGQIIGMVSRQGFNDLENKQGYVNAANGSATNAYTFMITDAEERAHNYVGKNEDLAKSAAKNEVGYYNFVAGMTGGDTLTSGGSYGTLSLSQQQWNQQYNTKNNELLLNNTAQANLVNQANTADSYTVAFAGAGCAATAPAGCVPGAVGGAVAGLLIDTGILITAGIATWYALEQAKNAEGILELELPNLTLPAAQGYASLSAEEAAAAESSKKTETKNTENTAKENGTKNETKVETKIEPKIEKQMSNRGWNKENIDSTIKTGKQEPAVDTRHNPATGTQNNAPATKYTNPDGSYVVRNNETGDIVQISNKNKPDWIPHGTK
jgi:hypothetical protein